MPKPRSSVALTYNGARSSEADFHGPLRDFVELPPQLVDEHLRWRVGLAVRAARRELKPGPVEVTWVTPAELVRGAKRVHAMPHRWGGWANGHEPDRIYVRADDELEAMETALHECRHLRQYQRRDEFPDYDGREADAIDWASRAMRLPAYPVG